MYGYIQYIHDTTDVLIRLDHEMSDEMSRNDWTISASNRTMAGILSVVTTLHHIRLVPRGNSERTDDRNYIDSEFTTERCSFSQRSEIETGEIERTIG
jgi:hypothetical protein